MPPYIKIGIACSPKRKVDIWKKNDIPRSTESAIPVGMFRVYVGRCTTVYQRMKSTH